MTTRPATSPLFATDATQTSGAQTGLSPRLDPGAGFRAQGWYANTRFAARHFNFELGLHGDWLDYLDEKGRYKHNLVNFGADPTGAVACDAAITAAKAAASSTGGIVWVPPGSFTHVNPIEHEPGVSWGGVPGASWLNINHATNDQQRWTTGSSNKSYTEIYGIGFGAKINNTGNAVLGGSGHQVRVVYRNCTWNDGGTGGGARLKGRLLLVQGLGSVFAYEKCHLEALDGGDSIALFSASGGELWLCEKTRLVMPATYTANLFEIDDGKLHVEHPYVDVTAHGGSADIFYLLSSGPHVFRGAEYHGAFSSGACIKAFGGTIVSEIGSLFDVVNPYDITGGALGQGSELTLGPAITTTYAGSGTIPTATGYRAQTLRLTNGFGGVGPSVALPDILFLGQDFDLVVVNASPSTNWTAGIGITGGVVAGAGATNSGYGRSFSFKAMDPDGTGTPRWFQMGDASGAFSV